jgi:predicted MPP superfamily phosphohydrolase
LWRADLDGPEPTWLLGLGNAVHTLIAAGWIAMRYISRSWPTGDITAPLMANAIGWAFDVVCLVLLTALMRWLIRTPSLSRTAMGPPDSSRRRFLVRTPAVALSLGGGATLARATLVDPWDLKVARYRVPIRDLPAGLDGLRLVQLSDTHLGPRIPAAFIRHAVEMALDLKPDLIALTGDYIHNGPTFIGPAAGLFKPLIDWGRPVVGVLGNHDWYADGREMSRALAALGVRMIDNGRLWLDAGTRQISDEAPAGAGLCIAGVGDLLTDWVDIPAALDGVPDEAPRLLLSHNPDTAEAVGREYRFEPSGSYFKGVILPRARRRVDLMLCGHTHGGQVRVPLLGTPVVPSGFGQRYAGGLVTDPGFPVVISRGVGMSAIPVRLGVPPEVVEVTLVRDPRSA